MRLKDYLENRGYEIEELNAKIIKQKNHFEETINLLRKENENIRLKMIEGERFMEAEV